MKAYKFNHINNGFFDGPLVLEPNVYKDKRGAFLESWNMNLFNKITGEINNFVQDNQSISQKGVLRGMHFQIPPFQQGKLIRCTSGAVYDVIVDLRISSKTFKLWGGIEINANNLRQVWIPPGFAHGFLSLEDKTVFEYKVTNYYSSDHEMSLNWDDKEIKVTWPQIDCTKIISEKDSQALSFERLSEIKAFFE